MGEYMGNKANHNFFSRAEEKTRTAKMFEFFKRKNEDVSTEEIEGKHAEGVDMVTNAFRELMDLHQAEKEENEGMIEKLNECMQEKEEMAERCNQAEAEKADLEAHIAELTDKLEKKDGKYSKLHKKYEALK